MYARSSKGKMCLLWYMFMSETEATTCPSCSEQSHNHREDDSGNMMGCGCGHSH